MITVKRMTLIAYTDRHDQGESVVVTLTPPVGQDVTGDLARTYATVAVTSPGGMREVEVEGSDLQASVVSLMKSIAGELASASLKKD